MKTTYIYFLSIFALIITQSNTCGQVDDSSNCSLTIDYDIFDETVDGANNGAINLDLQNGSSPYQYIWSNGAETPSVSDLAPGTYDVTVLDANYCEAFESIVVQVGVPDTCLLEVQLTSIQQNPLGANNGSIDVSVVNGVSPYDYFWSNGAVTPSITNLSPGNYTVTVSDATECIEVYTMIID